MSSTYRRRFSFICDFCREECGGGCHEKLTELLNGNMDNYEENKDLLGRKQIIHCLGPYCDVPCSRQKEKFTPYNEDDGLDAVFGLISWMGENLNEFFTKGKRNDD